MGMGTEYTVRCLIGIDSALKNL